MGYPLRYVVLHHTGVDRPHIDLMVETSPGSLLATWRTSRWPAEADQMFEPLKAHRREYLEYQGPVSNGGGEVKSIATGLCRICESTSSLIMVEFEDGFRFSLNWIDPQ